MEPRYKSGLTQALSLPQPAICCHILDVAMGHEYQQVSGQCVLSPTVLGPILGKDANRVCSSTAL